MKNIKAFAFQSPHAFLFCSVLLFFGLSAVQGLSFAFAPDYFVYISISQNIFQGGTLYKDAIDTKNAGFFFLFYWLIYCPYALLFTTTEYLHLWHSVVLVLWYTALASLVFALLKPLYSTGKALTAALACLLFILGHRHSLFFNQPQAAVLFVLLLLWVIGKTYARQSLADYFIYGLLLGLCFFMASPYLFLTLMIPFMAWQKMGGETVYKKRRFFFRLVLAGLGFAVLQLPILFYFYTKGALADWFFWNFTFSTGKYYSNIEFSVLTALQILPLFFFLPWKGGKNIFRRSLWAYLACFGALLMVGGLVIAFASQEFAGSTWDIGFLKKLEGSQNLLVRLSVSMYDFPIKNMLTKPLIAFIGLFAGNNILIAHTPQIIYHYFLLDTVLIAGFISLAQKKYPPLPILLAGLLALLGRLNLVRVSGSDTYNIYLIPLVVLWLPHLLEVFKDTAFPALQKSVLALACGAALIHIPIWSLLKGDSLKAYSPQVKEIVRLNPQKTPSLITYPWVFSYSTRWKNRYYNMYQTGLSGYPQKLEEIQPETVLMWAPSHWREFSPEVLEPLTNYQNVISGSYWLFIRKDKIAEWRLP